MGSEINNNNKKKNNVRTSSRSSNLYLGFLIKMYRHLCQTTISKFNQTVMKRLTMSKKIQVPISLSEIVRYFEKKKKTIVVVGKILNDERCVMVPKISVCALQISSSARERIIKSDGKIFTFDQLATEFPTGKNCFLIRGSRVKRKRKY
ncbi:60S ribosomal protein L18 (nucleomorph) [Chroomonas mesostigmatica CCMP1168]|uniref:60S ribosomal protein L18 n=1 Tax=Chroomonas mesostigmatica CCMP1168 TaxID=1195612 RepID=J7GA17_9CRYP|nr:60S ribosomal protein L18 [Chroomonas mesostigmatica CCMP1168]|mmetsp:Transcript_60046/g.147650  ORF Transcript_60046/g.147650 Transcript_60046/m.147650 type:complete len:149 (-) Transcript_60046:1548-1994(-)